MTRLHLQEYYLLCCNFHRNFDFTDHFLLSDCSTAQSERPHNTPSATPVSYHTNEVWPLPLSLATTHGITICFLFLRVLRCFTSPRSLQLPYIFRQRLPDMTPVFQGFPIRKSTDQSLFTNSPWLIAGYNVLHRLLVPRHPPIALSSLLNLQRCSRPL